jgi:tRNA-2-methylthio-N6-dimethylallyladenosine synthase
MSKRETFKIESMDDILSRNEIAISKISDKNKADTDAHGVQKRACTVTYGCQMNEHDSEKLTAMLAEMGYAPTERFDDADLIIFNTCCVRENAELRVFGNLGHIKKIKEKKPDLILAVCGCMMQQPHIVDEIKRQYRHVDLVFGTHNLHNFPELLLSYMETHQQVVEIWQSEGDIIEGLPADRKFDVKAFVNIMYGCNNFCAYCIVPYTRGRERSRKPEDVLAEIKMLADNGVREVMLLGQNVNSYGKTFEAPYDFADLLHAVNDIPGIERIRFMTSHPKDISDKLLETIASCEHVCESLHLPVQAGSNRVLTAMNRHYNREQYLEIIRKARQLMPNIGITTDIIVGFPGETFEEFMETVDLVKTVGYDSAFTFIYSRRTGTPAAAIEDLTTDEEKHRRFDLLLNTVQDIVKEKIKTYQDQIVEVLVENYSKHSEAVLMGRTPQGITVTFEGSSDLIGSLVKVRVTRPKHFSLFGERIETEL